MFNPTHQELVLRGEKWLSDSCGCGVIIRDPFKARTKEQPDVLGWRDGVSILIEAKVSRADFLKDKKKPFRLDPESGMGDWRFYLCPPGVISAEELPEGWGLIYALPKNVKKVSGVPANTQWYTAIPNVSNKRAENQMLVSALRRLKIRGYLPEIYDGLPIKEKIESKRKAPKRPVAKTGERKILA